MSWGMEGSMEGVKGCWGMEGSKGELGYGRE